ncbi:MAG: hypothetical protein ACFNL1_06490 [Prevotella histicola]
MVLRKIALSVAVMAAFTSLSVQAQTTKTEKKHETLKERIDTLVDKAKADVKHAEKATAATVKKDAQKVKAGVKHAEETTAATVKKDAQKVKGGVKHAEAVGKKDLHAGEAKVVKAYDNVKQKVRNTYRKDKAKVKAWEKARKERRLCKKQCKANQK